LYCRRVEIPYDEKIRQRVAEKDPEDAVRNNSPWATVRSFLPILVPLALIATSSFLDKESTSLWSSIVRMLGTPIIALLLGMVLAALLLPRVKRLQKLNELLERSIERSAGVILITGAGGGLGGVIKAGGLGDHIAEAFAAASLPGVLFPFLLASALTTATGSLTVSMTTSATIVASMGSNLGLSPEMSVALIGAGSLCVIHANSSFFWLLSRLHEVRPDVLYRTYSVQSICMALGGLGGALFLWACGIR
jgi:GntP family gluconate:H+ symporter